jgi:cytochrome c oxidase subunit 3
MVSGHKNHPYHLVDPSPWPILTSFSTFLFALGIISFLHHWKNGVFALLVSFIILCSMLFWWWSDVIFEAKNDGAHNHVVKKGLKIGMIFLILAEAMFFVAFFGAFFYLWWSPVNIFEDLWTFKKGVWPPEGIKTINAWNLPLLNTVILLLSARTAIWANSAAKEENAKEVTYGLFLTIILGILFSSIQFFEYHHAGFGLKEEGYKSFYTSLFYMLTGFHGLHVIIGTFFLIICLIRNLRGSLKKNNHLALDFAVWYWEFVDIVWIGLFIFLYVLASGK